MKENLATALRYAIIAIGGNFVGQGIISQDELTTIAGGGAVVLTAIYYYAIKPLFARFK